MVDAEEASHTYGLDITKKIPEDKRYKAAICAVAHYEFKNITKEGWENIIEPKGVLFDLKGIMPRSLKAIRM